MPFIVEFHRQKAIPQKGRIRRTVEVLDGKEHADWDSELDYGGAEKNAKHPWDEKEALNY